MDARHNNNKPGDVTGFPVTFVMTGCGNASVRIQAPGGGDHGCGDKVNELSTHYNLVAEPSPSNPRDRRADTDLPELSRTGALDAELFYWARCMYQTITEDVCTSRHMQPLPPSVQHNEAERGCGQLPHAQRLSDWFDTHTEACLPAAATPTKQMKKAAEDCLGHLDGTVWSECLKDQAHQGRHRPAGQPMVRFMFHNFASGRSPCKLCPLPQGV